MHDGTRPLPLALKACLFLAAFTLFAAVYALTDAARVDIALPPGVRAVGVVMAPHMGESRDRIGFVCVERVATPAGLG